MPSACRHASYTHLREPTATHVCRVPPPAVAAAALPTKETRLKCKQEPSEQNTGPFSRRVGASLVPSASEVPSWKCLLRYIQSS
ncbi:Hypothetical predicted protein [Podarcis lilfordi]|uniref:Uncharacterized protein n=1 Tax=Podarcis lilfordi TaxID=74358 RepID=A0AA35PGP3_9SAUR|nr:Hypothetical predicted protein [Podarcis lilfordi]